MWQLVILNFRLHALIVQIRHQLLALYEETYLWTFERLLEMSYLGFLGYIWSSATNIVVSSLYIVFSYHFVKFKSI